MKKTIFTLNIDNYAPEICDITYPLIKRYARKIGADFHIIKERKFDKSLPPVIEKFQVYELSNGNDWSIYLDSDTLVHPETVDWTNFLNKDTVLFNGVDMGAVRWKYNELFLRDGRNIGACFEAGTIIAGSGKTIENIKEGDIVSGQKGQQQKVTHIFKRKYTGKLCTVKVACMPKIRVTEEHPILVCNKTHEGFSEPKWKEVKDVKTSDWVVLPRNKTNIISSLNFFTQGGGKRKGKKQNIKTEIDESLAWLLGIYVAEGWISEGNRINFGLNKKEIELADKIVSCFKKIGINARKSNRLSCELRGSMQVVVNNASLSRVFDEMCGHGAINKKIPVCILNSPEPIIRAFIKGLCDGDGCFVKNKRTKAYRITTISKQLAFDLLSAFYKIGVNAHAGNPRKNRDIIEGRKVNTKPCYEINYSVYSWLGIKDTKGRKPNGWAKFSEDNVFLPITEITSSEVIDFPVYNIETQDHTYSVPFNVHNCTWNVTWSDWCRDLWTFPEDPMKDIEENIFPTVFEKNTVVKDSHLIDDYTLSKNIARFGLKVDTIDQNIMTGDGLKIKVKLPQANFYWHQYTITIEEKVKQMKQVVEQWKV